jgi:hypothetical protein
MLLAFQTICWIVIVLSPIFAFFAARWLKNGSKKPSTHV